MPYLIKRHANRKLYDPQVSHHVRLHDVETLIRAGREIVVIDATGRDVTGATLTQIILDNARRRRSRLPARLLHQLIKYSAAPPLVAGRARSPR
jgi:polyhydroxyalkanoate synthesis repressor PhaR